MADSKLVAEGRWQAVVLVRTRSQAHALAKLVPLCRAARHDLAREYICPYFYLPLSSSLQIASPFSILLTFLSLPYPSSTRRTGADGLLVHAARLRPAIHVIAAGLTSSPIERLGHKLAARRSLVQLRASALGTGQHRHTFVI